MQQRIQTYSVEKTRGREGVTKKKEGVKDWKEKVCVAVSGSRARGDEVRRTK